LKFESKQRNTYLYVYIIYIPATLKAIFFYKLITFKRFTYSYLDMRVFIVFLIVCFNLVCVWSLYNHFDIIIL